MKREGFVNTLKSLPVDIIVRRFLDVMASAKKVPMLSGRQKEMCRGEEAVNNSSIEKVHLDDCGWEQRDPDWGRGVAKFLGGKIVTVDVPNGFLGEIFIFRGVVLVSKNVLEIETSIP